MAKNQLFELDTSGLDEFLALDAGQDTINVNTWDFSMRHDLLDVVPLFLDKLFALKGVIRLRREEVVLGTLLFLLAVRFQ
jgi:hypothetical protein